MASPTGITSNHQHQHAQGSPYGHAQLHHQAHHTPVRQGPSSSSSSSSSSSFSSSPDAAVPFLQMARTAFDRVEEAFDSMFMPLRPYVGPIGRFLLVVTFLEDSLRIVSQWHEQVWYLSNHRGMHRYFAYTFLGTNVTMMVAASSLAILQVRTLEAVLLLFFVILSQSIGYGLILDFSFFVRNLAVSGGLLILLADAYYQKSRSKSFFPGLPEVSESQRTTYLQLVGRLLLALLFASFVFGGYSDDNEGSIGIVRALFMIAAAFGCIMVAVGFKAKRSALFLAVILSLFNIFINSWWSLHHTHPQRDFMKYDFFQTLSIMGGLILLSNIGPGNLSIDEKKKAY